MGDVIDILEHRPHMQGDAVCLHCKHKWKAVAPVEVIELECPECGLMKGVFSCICMPETYWQCNCGNSLFGISATGNAICAYCGKAQSF